MRKRERNGHQAIRRRTLILIMISAPISSNRLFVFRMEDGVSIVVVLAGVASIAPGGGGCTQ